MTTACALAIVANYRLSDALDGHQIDVLEDGSISIDDNGIDDPARDCTPKESVHLDSSEAYRLYLALHDVFQRQGEHL